MRRFTASLITSLLFSVHIFAFLGCGSDGDAGGSDERDAAMDASSEVAADVHAEPVKDAADEASSDAADDHDSGDGAPDASELLGPNQALDRFCSEPWEQTVEEAAVGALSGDHIGAYQGLPIGTLELMKVIPEHPFRVSTIRVAFAGGSGNVRIRLMRMLGRSYPDLDSPDGDLVPWQEFEVQEASPDTWIDIDVSSYDVFLEPTEHYAIVFEQIEDEPLLAVEDLPDGETSRALMLVPGESVPYGSEGNFRMDLGGQTFCQWSQADRWFGESTGQPFAQTLAQYGAFVDLDGDGHVDIVLNQGGPKAFFGDGQGGFIEPAFDPFPDTPRHTLLIYGDLDNDGDVDAFASANVPPDRDGDGVTLEEGDCNDAVPEVKPGAVEVPDNGLDDDCDGTVDDGTSVDDADGDGVSVADGDCDDTRDDVFPGAMEKLDGRDNDCDGAIEEDFFNRVLLKDGQGLLSAVPRRVLRGERRCGGFSDRGLGRCGRGW